MKINFLILIVVMVVLGYVGSAVMDVAETIHKRTEILNSALQGK